MRKRKIIFYILTPVILGLAILPLSLTGIFDTPESKVFDLLLELKPPAQPDKSILLVDTAGFSGTELCEKIGKSLVTGRVLGLKAALLPFIYRDSSSRDPQYCDSLAKYVSISGIAFIPVKASENRLSRVEPGREDDPHIMATSSKINIKTSSVFGIDETAMAPPELLLAAKGTGFMIEAGAANKIIRGVPLVVAHKGLYIPELGFSCALWATGYGDITLDGSGIMIAGGTRTKETILPLAWNGGFLPNLSTQRLSRDFRRIEVKELIEHDENTEKLHARLIELRSLGYLAYYQRANEVFASFQDSRAILDSLYRAGGEAVSDDGFERYKSQEERFLDETDKLLKSSIEDEVSAFLKRTKRNNTEASEAINAAASGFREARELFESVEKARAALRKSLPGSIAIYTDIPQGEGVSPPQGKRWDGILSAGVLSTILSEKFITIFPFWLGYAAALVLSISAGFIMRRLMFVPSLVTGFAFVVFFLLVDAAFFVLGRYYTRCVEAAGIMILSTLVFSITDLTRRRQDLFFMKASVSGRLSQEAINEIVANPESIRTDGGKKIVTVLASEVKAFSIVASRVDPGKLIEMIKQYHSEMGGAILSAGGTIEKHEQDATLAFFGYPLPVPDNAFKASLAALHMKKLDRSLNKHFIGSRISPLPFLTRIGIATGEVITGNIGDDLLPDFAILGSAPNIAKQLRTINSIYGTSILMIENTFKQVKADFAIRQLDRVRIGKMPIPVRIYELLAEKDSAPPQLAEMIELCHDGLYLFEKREWKKAIVRFQKALTVVPGDKTAKVYIARCRAYLKKPPLRNWDGVFKVVAV